MLVVFVRSDAARGFGNEQAAIVEKAVRQRQPELREAAQPRGERLFADESARDYGATSPPIGEAAVALKEPDVDEADGAPVVKRVHRQSAPRRRASGSPKA